MRKYFLSLALICSLLLLAGMGDAAPKLHAAPITSSDVSISYLTHPNTELDAAGFHNLVPGNPVSRSSHFAIDCVCLANVDLAGFNFSVRGNYKYQVHYKAYLTHNYPSHNFW